MSDFHAFTLGGTGRLRELITELGISHPFTGTTTPADTPIHKTRALWDTGATNSVITKATAESLSLMPVGKTKVFHADGESTANTYLVNIFLPNNLIIPSVRVSECANNAGSFGAIIGMDIITAGDFSITNVAGKTKFSFRLPSVKAIDYVAEADQIRYSLMFGKAGRNDLCPCGSKKKFKQCHGKGR